MSTSTDQRPLVLDLLPATHGAAITDVAVHDPATDRTTIHPAAWLSADGRWRTITAGETVILDPHTIIGFTVCIGADTTTWTEGADETQWVALVRRDVTPMTATDPTLDPDEGADCG
ncbi:hypothetical protein [Micrococcus sp.]|uniref:hypothetical protein n=1 Tax=Micrococcus sp. TaxID=1271 RepID=UPI002A90E884|nr:hypothetical protein [Micrococcus sp.]MDY6054367.1 hypothetical protein [Micrococcus sp.]